MAQDINSITLSGRLGKAAETQFFGDGKSAVKFSIAVNSRVKSGDGYVDKPMWVNIVLYSREGMAQYLTKGKQVLVSGRLTCSEREADDGTKRYFWTVVASDIVLCGGGKSESEEPSSNW